MTAVPNDTLLGLIKWTFTRALLLDVDSRTFTCSPVGEACFHGVRLKGKQEVAECSSSAAGNYGVLVFLMTAQSPRSLAGYPPSQEDDVIPWVLKSVQN